MNHPPLPSDDLPSFDASSIDNALRRQLEESIGKHFYQSCDGVTQGLLTSCEWYFTITTSALTLVIVCPDLATNWRVLHNIVPIGKQLERFADTAKIRVCPPVGSGTPFEIRVNEISIYRDSLADDTF
jgi:hypothetical protein